MASKGLHPTLVKLLLAVALLAALFSSPVAGQPRCGSGTFCFASTGQCSNGRCAESCKFVPEGNAKACCDSHGRCCCHK